MIFEVLKIKSELTVCAEWFLTIFGRFFSKTYLQIYFFVALLPSNYKNPYWNTPHNYLPCNGRFSALYRVRQKNFVKYYVSEDLSSKSLGRSSEQ